LIALIINAHPLGSGDIDLKDQLASDRSDGVRSSSRQIHPTRDLWSRPELGVSATSVIFITTDARSDPTSSRCQISFRYRSRHLRIEYVSAPNRHRAPASSLAA